MKLRNKKTGEIVQLSVKCENGGELRTFDLNTNADKPITLAELNDEWEDYEEPKEYWFIDTILHKIRLGTDKSDEEWIRFKSWSKEIGNYFETKEEAERAVEKLKAWKRLRDNGFKFEGIEKRGYYIKFYQGRSYETDKQCQQAMKDLDLLFGGEDE